MALEKQLGDALSALLHERCSASAAIRERHGQGESYHPSQPPDLVAFPKSTEEVAAVVLSGAFFAYLFGGLLIFSFLWAIGFSILFACLKKILEQRDINIFERVNE